MAVETGYDEHGAEVRVETGCGVVTGVEGLGRPLLDGVYRNYRVTIRAAHNAVMRFPVTALTAAGEDTLGTAYRALSDGSPVDYVIQVRRCAGIDPRVTLSELRASAEAARTSVRRILVGLAGATSGEGLVLSAARPAPPVDGLSRCA